MSIFQDTTDVYHLDWYSSPWKPYYNKLTSRVLPFQGASGNLIKVWCAEEELKGKTFILTVTGNSGDDHLTSVALSGESTTETDNFEVTYDTAHDDRPVKWWYGPGVAMQFPDGIHATDDYTDASTTFLHTIIASDIGERVYDGGLHCWMKLPHSAQDGGSAPLTQTDFYSKNIPMEYINKNDFLMVFNSYGHRPIKISGTNVGLTIQFQFADVLNASDGQFVNTDVPIWDDINITDLTDVNSSYMAASLITSATFNRRESAKSIRFYWYTEDTTGTEAIFHGGQFIRVSLYPIKH
jgi:hypothetical protein